jgi:cellulose synthase/poly-beta-1,6-N-acetylglucosamine synthase-like glycosyltransferase/peptidoglycan/xylan/chitin deacetylase (PgdA/CDA1 family)
MTERPIFVDPTGRRGRISTVIFVLLLVGTVGGLYFFVPRALNDNNYSTVQQVSAEPLSAAPLANASTADMASEISRRNVPVLGEGPLIRVMKLSTTGQGMVASDPFSPSVEQQLNEKESQIASGHQYAIVRYGQTATKRIALTFDDGPDPIYSPQLLDAMHKVRAQSTFFVTGANVIKYPEIAQRMVREGHTIANHSFSHPNFIYKSEARTFQEINQTDHSIRAVTQRQTPFFRPPYVGMDDQELRNNIKALLDGQKHGYINALYNFDTKDWGVEDGAVPPMPKFDGKDIVMLMHDSGGDRTVTVDYVKALLSEAEKNGYEFANLDQLLGASVAASAQVKPTSGDKASHFFLNAGLVWPHKMIKALFSITVVLVLVTLLVNFTLAFFQNRRMRDYKRRARNYTPDTAVIIPAYNEGRILGKTVKSLLRSRYKVKEIIIVDDGSDDNTFESAQKLAAQYDSVQCFRKENGGKSSALNFGLQRAASEIVVCMDADTVFLRSTISRLVRHFKDPAVGCVAGTVKVGNPTNLLSKWQALEYLVCVYVDRSAQAFLNSIMIAPGACSAWRAEAIEIAGNYSGSTFAEDCDITLALQRSGGYRIVQDSTAYSYTEAPLHVRELAKQRFRWIFGNLQAIWKHKSMIFRREHGWLGMYFMPLSAVNIILPVLFMPILFMLAVINLLGGNYAVMLVFFGLTLLNQFLAALAAVVLARERFSLLWFSPVTRLIYGPLKSYLVYRSVLTIAKGASVFWNKLQRTGTVTNQYNSA